MEKRYYRLMFDGDKNLISCVRTTSMSDCDFLIDDYGRIVYQDVYLYVRTDDTTLYYELVLSANSSGEAVTKACQFIANYVNNTFENQQQCCGSDSSETCCCDEEDDNTCDDSEELFMPSIKCDKCDVDAEEIYFSRDISALVTDDVKLRHIMGSYLVRNLLKNVRVLRSIYCIEDIHTVTTEFHSFDVDLFYDFLAELVAYHENSDGCECCDHCSCGDEEC